MGRKYKSGLINTGIYQQTRIDGLDQKIISLYAKGMSVSDIKTQLQELYGAEISESLISRITDEVIGEVKIWQSRPLESVYPIVYFDCLVVKVRQDKLIINKSVYVALGIDLSGRKDILVYPPKTLQILIICNGIEF